LCFCYFFFLFFENILVKVLVFLTMPIEPSSSDIWLQVEYLWGLKAAITLSGTIPVVVSLLEGPLENLDR
jgi:timeless